MSSRSSKYAPSHPQNIDLKYKFTLRDQTVQKKDRKKYLQKPMSTTNTEKTPLNLKVLDQSKLTMRKEKNFQSEQPDQQKSTGFNLKGRLKNIFKKSQKQDDIKQLKQQNYNINQDLKNERYGQKQLYSSVIINKDNQYEPNNLIALEESINYQSENFNKPQIEQIEDYQQNKIDEEAIKFIQLIGEAFQANNEKLQQYSSQSFNIFKSLQLKNYYLSKYLTSGGEGDIFLGYKESDGDEDQREEFVFKIYFGLNFEEIQEEINIMKSFEEYINIIKLQDEIQVENLSILVLERCVCSLNDELNEILRLQEEVSLKQLFQIIFDLIDGLIQLRIYQTLHLDIKPANILKTSQGSYVFTDFGCSQRVQQGQQIQLKGLTKNYASYEQLNNQIDKIHFKSDIQSLGKTFKYVIQIFKIVNQKLNYFYDQIMDIIEKNMDNNNISDRGELTTIHTFFFSLLIEHKYLLPSYLRSYSFKCEKIKQLFSFDIKKDIKYYSQIKLYYSKIHLDIFKSLLNFISNIQYKKLFEDLSFEIIEQHYSINIAGSLKYLGQCYFDLGDSQNALKYANESLQINEKIQQGNHLSLSSSYYLLGLCYKELGDKQSALKYAKKSLETNQQYYQGNHPSISSSLVLIGQCYFDLGYPQNALKYIKESLEMHSQLYQGNHESISTSLLCLGQCYFNLGDSQNALKYATQSLEMDQQLYEGNHPSISSSLYFLGQCYQDLGDSQNALKYAKESLEMKFELYEGNHPTIGSSLLFLGQCYRGFGDTQNALKYGKESLEIFKRFYLGNHPYISDSLEFLGRCFNDLDDSYHALRYFIQSLEMHILLYKRNHPSISLSKKYIGEVYLKLGDSQIAFQYAKESFEMLKLHYKGENHPLISVSLSFLCECYQTLGDKNTALKCANESLEMSKQLCKNHHPLTSESLYLIGECFREVGDPLIALEYFKESFEMQQQIEAGNISKVSCFQIFLSQCYMDLGDSQNALKHAQEFLKIHKQLYVGSKPKISYLQFVDIRFKYLEELQNI